MAPQLSGARSSPVPLYDFSATASPILQQLLSRGKQPDGCNEATLRSRVNLHHPPFVQLCRVFPIPPAGLLIQPGRAQPRRGRVEAGREPGHQERFDPGVEGLYRGEKKKKPYLPLARENTFNAGRVRLRAWRPS